MFKGILILLGFAVAGVATGGIAIIGGASIGLGGAIAALVFAAFSGGTKVALEISADKQERLKEALQAAKRLNTRLEREGIQLKTLNTTTAFSMRALKEELSTYHKLTQQQKRRIVEDVKVIQAAQEEIAELAARCSQYEEEKVESQPSTFRVSFS